MAKMQTTITITDVLPPGIIRDILVELKRAKEKHPEFPDRIVPMTAIMAEEAGEAIREANLIQFENAGTMEQYEKELKQTAAMCIRILEILEQNK